MTFLINFLFSSIFLTNRIFVTWAKNVILKIPHYCNQVTYFLNETRLAEVKSVSTCLWKLAAKLSKNLVSQRRNFRIEGCGSNPEKTMHVMRNICSHLSPKK